MSSDSGKLGKRENLNNLPPLDYLEQEETKDCGRPSSNCLSGKDSYWRVPSIAPSLEGDEVGSTENYENGKNILQLGRLIHLITAMLHSDESYYSKKTHFGGNEVVLYKFV